MKRTALFALGVSILSVAACAAPDSMQNGGVATSQQTAAAPAKAQTTQASSIYDFTMKDIDGKDVPLSTFKGKVLLVVNVATYCGNTPQYEALEKAYEQNKDKGLVILGFPANEFGQQEPGTNSDIKQFCTSKYNVSFPMFSKIVVKGDGISPLYTWLVANAPYHDDVEWNFGKFLIGRDGKVVNRFKPGVKPDAPEVTEALQAALSQSK